MKKLLFTIAAAATFAALAIDPSPRSDIAPYVDIDVLGFESFNFDDPLTTNGVIGVGDDGKSGATKWVGSVDDSSLVKTYGGEGNATNDYNRTCPAPFENQGDKYLALDTNGSELKRLLEIDPNDGTPVAKQVAADGTYIDTLVQFTVTEDEEPTIDSTTKLAIWLGVDTNGVSTTTNLYVKGGEYSVEDLEDSEITVTTKSYKLSGDYEPGVWYRLTVKAIATLPLVDGWSGSNYPGFQIFIDGNETPLSIVGDQAYTGLAVQWFDDEVLSDSSLLTGGTFIPSAVTTLSGAATTLTSVGFQGTGSIDDLVVTTKYPFSSASTIDFTLTWDANVTAVSYTIDGTTTTIADLSTFTNVVPVAAGTEVTVAATPAAWYEISSGTGAVTVAAAMTQDIVAALAATPGDAGATGLPAGVTTAQAKTWADAQNLTPAAIAACSYADAAYLLNTDLTNEPTFEITAIEEVSGGWQITVEAKSGSTDIDLGQINGTLKVKTGATLSDLASATSETATFTVGQDGTATTTITGTGKNFIKATVE